MTEVLKQTQEENSKGGIYTTRRDFFTIAGWGVFLTTMLAYAWEILGPKGFFFSKVLFEPSPVFSVGIPSDFAANMVATLKSRKIFIIRDGNSFKAISTVCQHLGCAVHWSKEKNVFECPCHGSKYYRNGVNFAGPALRPLYHYKLSLSDDGKMIVDTSKKVPLDTELII
ncbi:MAG: ubiquinol-cytochrome c reductase iron-sulfur subunit [Candidatus Scalinduaceae bacterium]